ncbi:MAG: hypothetical protein LBH19_02585 [Dysgonamonadaceae bacterium]|nr:hypothetical protein [Dysgonamonadaceae bacterium]
MKRIYFTVLMLLICIGSFSQKVKIKKNIISIDDVEVGITEKYKSKETQEAGYTYSDLKGENKFTLIRYYLDEDNLFFVIRPDFKKDTAEIKMEYLYFTLNEHNGLTDLLIKKYHFFDKNGMNVNAISEYLSAGYEQQIPIIQKRKQAENDQKRIIRDMDIQVADNNSTITAKGEKVGSFVSAPNPNQIISAENPIVFRDESGNVVARVTKNEAFEKIIETYDRNTFKLKISASYNPQRPNVYYKEIAEFLASKEYLKGQRNSFLIRKAEYAEMQKEANEARAADLKARTEVEGILTLKDGTKIEGTFKFNYRQTEDGKVTSPGSIADLDAGKILFHLYADEKGNSKVKKYGVKEVSTFYISDNEVYKSVTYKRGNRLKEAASAGELNVAKVFGGSKIQKFLLCLVSTEKACLYFYDGEYILMKPGSEDAVTGKTLNPADLTKFTSDCPEFSQKIANKQYGADEKSYRQLVEDYTKCF